MSLLRRRLSKLEARRPVQRTEQMVDANDLAPAVLTLWLAVDIDQMTLPQLEILEADLRRLTV